MKEWQKIIKYLAIAFGIYLTFVIISAIVGIIGMIGTGIFATQFISSNVSDNINFSEKYNNINGLNIDVSNCNFYIQEGKEFYVEASNIDSSTKFENENGVLKVKEKSSKIFKNKSSKIIIYIPSGYKLDNVIINLGLGKSDISNLNCEKLDMNYGAGKVNIDNVNSNKTTINCGTGNITVENSTFKDLDLDCGVGKFSFNGFILGNSNIDCGVGETDLDLKGNDYTLITENDLGTVSINNSNVSGKQTTGNGKNRIDISGGIGTLDINT